MTELPIPPNVPSWLLDADTIANYLDGAHLHLTRSMSKENQHIADYFFAAVYAQLWLAEAKRIEAMPLSELLKKRYVYAQSWTKIRQDALDNADLCAAEMKRIGEKA